MIILPIFRTSLIHFFLKKLGECTFFNLGVKGLEERQRVDSVPLMSREWQTPQPATEYYRATLRNHFRHVEHNSQNLERDLVQHSISCQKYDMTDREFGLNKRRSQNRAAQAPQKHVVSDVTLVGQCSSPWPDVNSVDVEIKLTSSATMFRFPCAQFMLRQMHWTSLSVRIEARPSLDV